MRRGLTLLVVVVALLVALPRAASAKSFQIVSVVIDASLRPDASMRVVERITYDFDGEFHNGTRPIPGSTRYQITDVSVTERGEPLPFDGAPYDLAWHYDAKDERRTFDIAYTVVGAAEVGTDVADLYWQWVGTSHPGGIGEVRVHLTVPPGLGEVKAWAHGPLNGIVTPSETAVDFVVTDLEDGTFVEGRVAVPATRMTAPATAGALLPGILNSEGRLADAANSFRTRARLLNMTFWVLPVFGWLIWLYLFRRFGREPDTAAEDVEYQREPLDDPPAVAGTLLKWGSVTPLAYSATVVDLAQRGALVIEEERIDRRFLSDKVDWRFTRKAALGDLRPFEQHVMDRLFADGETTTQSDQIDWAKAHATSAKAHWTEFTDAVKADYKSRRYEEKRGTVIALNVVVAIAIGVASFLAMGVGLDLTIGVPSMVLAGLQLVASVPLRQRTAAGNERAAEWQAFTRFLKDFSRLGEAPVGHLILWERYLVYSVAFGISEDVAEGLAMRIPPEQQSSFAPWYGGGLYGHNGSSGAGAASFGSFAAGFGSSMHSAFVPSSSSSGSGGGFSGGGGGGGGGGGIGAS